MREATSYLKVSTLMLGDEGRMLDADGVSQGLLALEFERGASPIAAGTYVAAAIMGDAIHRDADSERKRIVADQLGEWSALDPQAQRAMRRHLREGTLSHQDSLVTRCQWQMLWTQDMLLENKITMADFKVVKDTLWEAIKEEPRGSRAIYGSKN